MFFVFKRKERKLRTRNQRRINNLTEAVMLVNIISVIMDVRGSFRNNDAVIISLQLVTCGFACFYFHNFLVREVKGRKSSHVHAGLIGDYN